MHQELMALTIQIKHDNNYTETLTDMLVAPSHVVRAFAGFMADREEEETVLIKGSQVPFQDCSVSVGDSKKVVAAFECLKHYDMPLTNYEIFSELIKRSQTAAWKLDPNFRLFEKWYAHREAETS